MTVAGRLHEASSYPTLVSDSFNQYKTSSTITDSSYYGSGASFPDDNDSASNNPSDTWTTDSGSLTAASGGWGFSGLWASGNRNFGRVHVRPHLASTTDCRYSFRCKFDAFDNEGGTQNGDAFDVWMGYQTQYRLYAVQLIRWDGGGANKGTKVLLKHKVPFAGGTFGGTGGNANTANSGIYYQIKTDTTGNPSGNNDTYNPTYSNAGVSNVADTATEYDFTLVKSDESGNVRIKVYRESTLVANFLDDGARNASPATIDSGSPESLNYNRSNGHFSGSTGYDVNDYYPLVGSGRVGWRSDNLPFYVKNVVWEDI